ncbi:MAG: hypothetical protein RBS92_02600, partial [Candidatus Cloacimonadales bacterium]|nr:hypothetical protein [Candidatus Cloacimonadales bacterium]
GVSSFSMFIYFIYRASRRFDIAIKNMSIDFILNVFSKFNSLNKLMKESLLYCLTMKLPVRNQKMVKEKEALPKEAEKGIIGAGVAEAAESLTSPNKAEKPHLLINDE